MNEDPSSPASVHVDLGARSYDILIGQGILANAGTHIEPHCTRKAVFVLTDETVASMHLVALEKGLAKAGISATARVVPAGESTKSLTQLEATLDWLLQAGANRDDVLIAFGGGVIGDLAGLAASLMKRGMRFIQIPTTLLAQVDSSVGGKTAVNTPQGKNLIGAFYQPRLVLADTGTLTSLPERQRRAGYAEILKYALIDDPGFFDWLEANSGAVLALKPGMLSHAIATSCAAKARIVAEDEREHGVRALLNLGHTFGHALEAANNYGPELLHGEAVGCGMAMALRYSVQLGLMQEQDMVRATSLIEASGLVIRTAGLAGGPYRPDDLVSAMRQDKKARAGRVPLILAHGIGQAFIQPEADLANVLVFLKDEETLTTK